MHACKRPAFIMSECVSLLTCQLAAVLCKSSKGWAEAHIKIARMTLTVKLDRNWSSFQLANSTPPLSVTGSAIAPSARMTGLGGDLISFVTLTQMLPATKKTYQHARTHLHPYIHACTHCSAKKKCDTLLDLCVSSLRRGHANLLCIVPILMDDP